MSDETTPWTDDDWAAWRAENVRLLSAGWRMGTSFPIDGSAPQSWAEKNGVRVDRTPRWVVTERGYAYGKPI